MVSSSFKPTLFSSTVILKPGRIPSILVIADEVHDVVTPLGSLMLAM